ncbi:unnamed protein product, partial [Discosporangium mesarthrocarpum]
KAGWVRCVGTDLKFHWVRHSEESSLPAATTMDGGSG